MPVAVLLCFLYGLSVLTFLRANATSERLLVSLIRHHTERSDCLVIVKALDPQTAAIARRIQEEADRQTVVADDLDHLPSLTSHLVILTAVPVAGAFSLTARTPAPTIPPVWQQKAVAWFNHSIARRQPGDRADFADAYFLYETRP